MERKTIVYEGSDCAAAPCGDDGCGEPAPVHQPRCEMWKYVVVDGDVALVLTVASGRYPASARMPPMAPKGDVLDVHVGFPTDREQVAGGHDGNGVIIRCEHVSGGRCYQGSEFSSVSAAVFLVENVFDAAAGLEQGEMFWAALEGCCKVNGDKARSLRADLTWERCGDCEGTGVIPKAQDEMGGAVLVDLPGLRAALAVLEKHEDLLALSGADLNGGRRPYVEPMTRPIARAIRHVLDDDFRGGR